MPLPNTREHARLTGPARSAWLRWGPYLAERAWATVREDYSADGNAWSYFPHDHARSRAYRWGEDGLAGWSDKTQTLCFAWAFWNGHDPILKERLFGLVPDEANHGEDVKELYYYLDATPTHSYMRWLYKYPQRAFPYAELVAENRRRGGKGPEYELLDTGVFADDAYFDIDIEYAKAAPEDLAIRVTISNRGSRPATLHVLPQLWFRNTWAWGPQRTAEPAIRVGAPAVDALTLLADPSALAKSAGRERDLAPRHLLVPLDAALWFTDNETHAERVFGAHAISAKPHHKDAFHRALIDREDAALNPARFGTKACAHLRIEVPAQDRRVLRFRLLTELPRDAAGALGGVDAVVDQRAREANEFYDAVHPPTATEDERRVQRQALAGLIWSKQLYLFDVHRWLAGDNPAWPPPGNRAKMRNGHWRHLNSTRIMSVPDKWEYPWFAAWDLAFQAVAFALVDAQFAKEQLWLLLFEQFLHPSGQIPAYEWEFSDLNPPVHAWAVWRVYNMDRLRSGRADRLFLERCFHKLLLNFAFWVNRVDREGNNVFEGGFLGLDNITVLDRSLPLPSGTVLEQSDATGWMGMFCLQLMRIALELAKTNPAYEALAVKFFQHYVYVGDAMKRMGPERRFSLWDAHDGFFYDVLRCGDGEFQTFRLRSLVGLVPLYAVERLEDTWIEPFAEFRQRFDWFITHRQDLVSGVCYPVPRGDGVTHVLAVFDPEQLQAILRRLLDSEEFMSPYGVRSLSKAHADAPFVLGDHRVSYEPGESDEKIKGGNSNWRGPVWFPANFLMIEALRKLGTALGPEFRVPADGRDGPLIPLREVAQRLADRLIRLFTRDEHGRRPIFGDDEKLQTDPHFRDHLLFFEHFHGDTGRGLGASHQTGWTALVASLIDEWRTS